MLDNSSLNMESGYLPSPWAGSHDSGNFAPKAVKWGMSVFGTGGPVDGIFQGTAHEAVVFGSCDEESVVGSHQVFEFFGSGGQARRRFAVFIEHGQVQVLQLESSDHRPLGFRQVGGQECESSVERLCASEPENASNRVDIMKPRRCRSM